MFRNKDKQKKSGKFSKFVVIICILFIVLYTIATLFSFYRTGNEPVVLTPLVYTFFGGELVILFLKKSLDLKNPKDEKTIDEQIMDVLNKKED